MKHATNAGSTCWSAVPLSCGCTDHSLLSTAELDGLAADDLFPFECADMCLESEEIGMILHRASSEESGYGTDGSTESVSSSSGLASSLNSSLNRSSYSPQGTPLPSMSTFLSSSPQNNNSDNFPDLNIPAVVTNHVYSAADSTTSDKPKSPLHKVNKRGRPRKNPEDPNGNTVKSHRGRKQGKSIANNIPICIDIYCRDT